MREYSRRAGPTTQGPMPLKKDNRLLIYDLDSLASRLLPLSAFPLRVLRRHLVLRSFSVFLVPSVSLPLRNNRLALLVREVSSRYLDTRGSSKSRVHGPVPAAGDSRARTARPLSNFSRDFPGGT